MTAEVAPSAAASKAAERPSFRLGVRAKLFFVSFGIIAVSVLIAHTYLSTVLERILTQRIESDLYVRAELVQREAESARYDVTDLERWDALADDLGRRSHARVTFIAEDGHVMGDSEVALAQLAQTENHSGRPEVQGARQTGHGSATRYSSTVQRNMQYVAVRFDLAPEHVGVARLALPLAEVDLAKAQLAHALYGGSSLALLIAAIMTFFSAQLMTRVARHLKEVAQAMAQRNFEARAHVGGDDEFAELGLALDQLAESLSGTLRELRSERDFIGRILTGMQEGVLLLDSDGKVALVNSALRHMLLLGADTRGKTPMQVIENEVLKELIDRARNTQATASAEIDLSGIKPRRLLVRAVPLPGEPGGLLAVFVDVTDIRRLESLRKDFVANASHELRTPVTAVRSAAETLRVASINDPESAPHFIDIIERNAERLQHLVEDLLDLSRIEAREFRLTFEPVEIDPFVPQAFALLQERAEKKNIQLISQVPRDLPAAWADRRALEQVLTNLVENAVKYSPEGTKIVVSAKEEGAMLRVSCTDNGPGIAQKHLPRLFERFYRVDAGRSRELGGTGLGLSIVKHLVEALGGAVGVESTVGKGSTFAFTMPKARDGAPPSIE